MKKWINAALLGAVLAYSPVVGAQDEVWPDAPVLEQIANGEKVCGELKPWNDYDWGVNARVSMASNSNGVFVSEGGRGTIDTRTYGAGVNFNSVQRIDGANPGVLAVDRLSAKLNFVDSNRGDTFNVMGEWAGRLSWIGFKMGLGYYPNDPMLMNQDGIMGSADLFLGDKNGLRGKLETDIVVACDNDDFFLGYSHMRVGADYGFRNIRISAGVNQLLDAYVSWYGGLVSHNGDFGFDFVSPSSGRVGADVYFGDSSGGALRVGWDFGDVEVDFNGRIRALEYGLDTSLGLTVSFD